MGVDTKLVCLTKNKNAFEVGTLIEKAIRDLIFDPSKRIQQQARITIDPRSKTMSVLFNYQDEQRKLFVVFDCDRDYVDSGLIGSKIILSLGLWGSSATILKAIGEELKALGPVFYQENDCNDDPLINL